MFKAILNFIRKLYEPKPGHCPKAIDYEWTNQEGTDVRRHEPSRTGGDPVDTLEAAVKAPKDSGEPRLVPDKRHMRTKPAEAAKDAESGEEKKPAAKKPVVKKTAAKKPGSQKARRPQDDQDSQDGRTGKGNGRGAGSEGGG